MIKQCCTSPPKPQIFPQIALGTNKQTSKIFKIWMEISLSVALSTFRVWIMGGVSFQLIGKWRGRRLWKSPSLTTSSRTATFANLDFSQIWLHSKQLQSPDGAQLTNTWSILSSSFIKKSSPAVPLFAYRTIKRHISNQIKDSISFKHWGREIHLRVAEIKIHGGGWIKFTTLPGSAVGRQLQFQQSASPLLHLEWSALCSPLQYLGAAMQWCVQSFPYQF